MVTSEYQIMIREVFYDGFDALVVNRGFSATSHFEDSSTLAVDLRVLLLVVVEVSIRHSFQIVLSSLRSTVAETGLCVVGVLQDSGDGALPGLLTKVSHQSACSGHSPQEHSPP